MISRISGKLIEKQPTYVVIDVNGIGYEIFISTQTFYALDEINENITLFIQSIVREDSYSLFGFINNQEKDLFRLLIKINGIGPKVALSILSVVSRLEFIELIINGNIKRLSSIPGIGKKTAERLILELKDKLEKINLDDSFNYEENQENDIIKALVSLGYNQKEALLAIKNIPKNITELSQAIKIALNYISKN